MYVVSHTFFFFFFNDTATTEIYTLSLHDALPISVSAATPHHARWASFPARALTSPLVFICTHSPPCIMRDRKSTRLNSSHGYISYAVFCLKKKKKHSSNTHIYTIVSHILTHHDET